MDRIVYLLALRIRGAPSTQPSVLISSSSVRPPDMTDIVTFSASLPSGTSPTLS